VGQHQIYFNIKYLWLEYDLQAAESIFKIHITFRQRLLPSFLVNILLVIYVSLLGRYVFLFFFTTPNFCTNIFKSINCTVNFRTNNRTHPPGTNIYFEFVDRMNLNILAITSIH